MPSKQLTLLRDPWSCLTQLAQIERIRAKWASNRAPVGWLAVHELMALGDFLILIAGVASQNSVQIGYLFKVLTFLSLI